MATNNEALRKIPSVEAVLQELSSTRWAAGVPHQLLAICVRQAVADTRAAITDAGAQTGEETETAAKVISKTATLVRQARGPHYRRAVNASGIILHTALGRAVLAGKALRQIEDELSSYSVLQIDTETGKRSRRDSRIEWMLRHLTGAEAATVVNNNAAATAIVLNTVGRGKEVIVSRGQLVEIGGSFRLPEVMEVSGAKMVEVGTTNKTHLRDYEKAITENTAAIIRVHPSNYKITGFTSEVPLADLVALARKRGIVLIDDVGAGALIDYSRFGFAYEPMLRDSIKAGADLTTSSADKLIGASQGGIILGRKDLVEAVRKNPFARIVRVGKLTLAALEATLSLFFDEAEALRKVPTLAMLMRGEGTLSEAAERIVARVTDSGAEAQIKAIAGSSQMGSGSLPAQDLPTTIVSIKPETMTADELALALRRNEPPIFARIKDDALLIDPRTLLEGDEQIVITALADILTRKE